MTPDNDTAFGLALFRGDKLNSRAASAAMRSVLREMSEAMATDIPVAGGGEISEWITEFGASSLIDSQDLKDEMANLEEVRRRISDPNEVRAAIRQLCPEGHPFKGLGVSELAQCIADRAGIQLKTNIPPTSKELRILQVTARCFDILKESPVDLVENAWKGDRSAVLNLVKIDKAFLTDSCTRRVIADAEHSHDLAFLKQLARAIRYTPRGGPRIVCRLLLYILFVLEIDLPKRSTLQLWLDPHGTTFPATYSLEKFLQRCRKEFEVLKACGTKYDRNQCS